MNPNIADTDIWLPGSEDLPCSDDRPVDNENQNMLPNWLLAVLEEIWGDRQDWYFGVDMGIYTREAQRRRTPFVIPDGFLSIGVQRHKREGRGRLSYVLQEEEDIVPILGVEMVSQTYGQEYDAKLAKYEQLGVLYYLIYNPEYTRRHQRQPFELYKLIDGHYQRQTGEPIWMPEIELGIGRVQGLLGGIQREWLAWHDLSGQPYPLPQQMIHQLSLQVEQAQAQAEQVRLENERLRAKLKQLGVDPDTLS
ncbi:MAG: Uma2 family endonuclease [Cyanobacteria bacterium P01_H01_bin.152]